MPSSVVVVGSRVVVIVVVVSTVVLLGKGSGSQSAVSGVSQMFSN